MKKDEDLTAIRNGLNRDMGLESLSNPGNENLSKHVFLC